MSLDNRMEKDRSRRHFHSSFLSSQDYVNCKARIKKLFYLELSHIFSVHQTANRHEMLCLCLSMLGMGGRSLVRGGEGKILAQRDPGNSIQPRRKF